MRTSIASAPFALIVAAAACSAQVLLQPPFNASYQIAEVGVPGVPAASAALLIHPDDPNRLLIAGAANSPIGALYAVPLNRNAEGHITGFAGQPVRFADAPYADGGVALGPDGVIFLARWPVNQLGQLRPGSTTTDRVISLEPLGVPRSISCLNFPPPGFPGAGHLKITTFGGGQWFDATISPDGQGTFNIDTLTSVPGSTLPGGPEGFTYVPAGSPLFPQASMLVSEYSNGRVSAYELDSSGNPIVSTRRSFITGLTQAEGAAIDPLTGDFLFSTFSSGGRIFVVRGFNLPTCRADFNDDGFINPDDMADFVTCFFVNIDSPGLCPQADFDGDGTVNPDDLAAFIEVFFGSCE
jgi:hypothetical protein